MIDKHLIVRKLKKIEGYLKETDSVTVSSFEDFTNNIITKRFIERNLELAIEQMLDVCKHIVSGLDLNEPETYAECFDIISKAGIISRNNTGTFKSMVRFRNILIHGYDDIDDSITYGIYTKHLPDFRTFTRIIRSYISEKTA